MKSHSNSRDSSDKHNWDWINTNRITARKFASENCPYKALMNEINEKLECKIITPEETLKEYNPLEDSQMRIKAYDTHIEFAILWAKNIKKGLEAAPIGYEYEPYKFNSLLQETYRMFKNKL